MDDYEEKRDENIERNQEFLDLFQNWLEDKDFTAKTINKHTDNLDFYLNEFLNYYDVVKMEDGVYEINSYLSDWFVRKCMWSSASSIKGNAASIKKFYQCMWENNKITKNSYDSLCNCIRENMDELLDAVDSYDNGTFFSRFM